MLPKDTLRLRIENSAPAKPRTFGTELKEVAPVLTSVGTLALAAVSFYFVHNLDREKAKLEQEKAASAAASLRQNAAAAYTEPDKVKREAGAMTLAGYGEDAIPSLHMLLSGNPEMRDFGGRVAAYLFSAGDVATREALVANLANWGQSPAKNVRSGSYTCFEAISDDLSTAEADLLFRFLNGRFGERIHDHDEQSGLTVCSIVQKFRWHQARTVLMSLVLNHPSANVVSQALDSISKIGSKLSENDGTSFVADLQQMIALSGRPDVKQKLTAALEAAKKRQSGIKR